MTTVIIEKADAAVISYEAAGDRVLLMKSDATVISFEPPPPEVFLFKADAAIMSYDVPAPAPVGGGGRRRQPMIGSF